MGEKIFPQVGDDGGGDVGVVKNPQSWEKSDEMFEMLKKTDLLSLRVVIKIMEAPVLWLIASANVMARQGFQTTDV